MIVIVKAHSQRAKAKIFFEMFEMFSLILFCWFLDLFRVRFRSVWMGPYCTRHVRSEATHCSYVSERSKLSLKKKKKRPNSCPVCNEEEDDENFKFARGVWACSKCHSFFGRWTVNAITGAS